MLADVFALREAAGAWLQYYTGARCSLIARPGRRPSLVFSDRDITGHFAHKVKSTHVILAVVSVDFILRRPRGSKVKKTNSFREERELVSNPYYIVGDSANG